MTNLARCPQCNAALPHGAPWCSLCHADLRPPPPEPEPELVVATSSATVEQAGEPAAALPPVRGRHRRGAPIPATTPAAAGAETPDALAGTVQVLIADAPKGEDGAPDLEQLTGLMMARLESSESARQALPAWDRVPGGKWTVLVGGMAVLTLVLVGLSAVLGAVFLR